LPGILKISEASSLAIHGLGLLAAVTDRPLTTVEIAKVLDVSHAHLAKVFQRLARAGLVRSHRGPKGGFFLGKDAKTTTLLEIFESIDGPIAAEDVCSLSFPHCDASKCVVGRLVSDLTEKVRSVLSESRLSDLIGLYQNMYAARASAPAGGGGRQ
jgi:Rrf2 family protein